MKHVKQLEGKEVITSESVLYSNDDVMIFLFDTKKKHTDLVSVSGVGMLVHGDKQRVADVRWDPCWSYVSHTSENYSITVVLLRDLEKRLHALEIEYLDD